MSTDWNSLIPRAGDRCSFCGHAILAVADAVLVPDDLGAAAWWHMQCRDIVIPLLLRKSHVEFEGIPENEATV
jgi:hypothetical protein